MKTTDNFVFFWGYKDFMSNFYHKPFQYKGHLITCSEIGFMMEKAIQFNDDAVVLELASISKASEAKKLGRKIKAYDDKVWNEVRLARMVEVLTEKFKDPELRHRLLDTGERILVEASPIDKIWGVNMDENHPDIETPSKWQGQNLLGIALMEIRKNL